MQQFRTHYAQITVCEKQAAIFQKCELVDRFRQLNTLLGSMVQQPNFTYIHLNLYRGAQGGIIPCTVDNQETGIPCQAMQTASELFSTTLFKRWRHIPNTKNIAAFGLNSVANREQYGGSNGQVWQSSVFSVRLFILLFITLTKTVEKTQD